MTSGADLVTIARRFRGPPGSGNGGYVAGLLAEWIDGPAEISLLAPIPLDVPLHRRREGSEVSLCDAQRVYVTGRPLAAPLELVVPPPPSEAEIEAAAADFPGPGEHPVPGCFVCGSGRAPGDGLCLSAGESPARDTAVAEWVPAEEFAEEHGHIAERFLWAALDCPSYFALGRPYPLALLARMAARIERPVLPGEKLRVTGWEIGREGRKFSCASAIHDEAGDLVALARALWVEVKALPA